jgi:hypothetical protein
MFITMRQSVPPEGLLILSKRSDDGLRTKLHSACLEMDSMLEFCECGHKTSDYKEGSVFLDQPSYLTFPTNMLHRAYN